MNSFFDDLLEKRHFPQCPLPLWRLKITDCEFDELHELLHRIASQFDRFDDPFVGYERECALYVAEWYRRKHTHGKPGFEIIYSSLEGRNANMGSFKEAAYRTTEHAHQGMNRIVPLKVNNKWRSYTLLLQGGLPLNRQDYKVLDNLLNKDFDFEKIGLHELAQLPESGIEKFCMLIKLAVDCQERERMPIYCSEELFNHLMKIANETKIKEREMNPFKIEFVCALDKDNLKFHLLYSFKPSSKVKEAYAQKFFPNAKDLFSVTLKNDGKTIRRCEYYNRVCQQADERKYQYSAYIDEESQEASGTVVELVNDQTGDNLLSDSYTYDVPHIFYRKEAEQSGYPIYKLADSIGRSAKNERLILSPKSWTLNADIRPIEYTDGTTQIKYNIYVIPAGDERKLTLSKNNHTTIDFSPESVLSWMSVVRKAHPIDMCSMNLVGSLDEIVCYRENEIGYKRRVSKDRLVFLPSYGNEWLSDPVPGKLKVTYKNEEGENFVTPEVIFYVGKGFKCVTVSGRETVKITLTWPHGNCRPKTENAKLINESNNTWEVKKEDLKYPYDIKIQFTPHEHPYPFYASLPCPFSGTYLYRTDYENGELEEIKDGDVIPLINFSSCMYSVVGNGNFRIEFTNKLDNIQRIWGKEIMVYPSSIVFDNYDADLGIKNKVTVKCDNSIPNALTKLVTSEELFQKLKELDNNITKAEIHIRIDKKNIVIKQYPFRISCDENGIFLKDRTNKPINYGPSLKYIPFRFDNWNDVLSDVTEGKFEIPSLTKLDDIYYKMPFSNENSESPVLIFSEVPGQILPRKYPLASKPAESPSEENPKEKFINGWKEKLKGEDATSEWIVTICWFEIVACTHIPFTSIHNLEAVCDNKLALLFLYKVYSNRKNHGRYDEDDENMLIGALNRMTADFSVKWSELIDADYLNQLRLFQIIENDDDFDRLIELLKE